MRVVIIDDYSRSVRSLRAFELLDGDDVTVLHEPITTPSGWQQCLAQAEALVLIRERSVIDASVLDCLICESDAPFAADQRTFEGFELFERVGHGQTIL